MVVIVVLGRRCDRQSVAGAFVKVRGVVACMSVCVGVGGRGGERYRDQFIVLVLVVVGSRLPVIRAKEWDMEKYGSCSLSVEVSNDKSRRQAFFAKEMHYTKTKTLHQNKQLTTICALHKSTEPTAPVA